MELSLTIGELAKDTGASFRVFVKKYSQERKYISKSINMPFLINTSLTYMTQVYYNISPIDENINQLKKSFSPLILFPLPPVNSIDYAKMMKLSNVSELNDFLGRFSEKWSKKKSEIFIKDNQDTLNDVLYLITNIITCVRFCTGCTIDSPAPPTIADILLELLDELFSAQCRSYKYEYSNTQNTCST